MRRHEPPQCLLGAAPPHAGVEPRRLLQPRDEAQQHFVAAAHAAPHRRWLISRRREHARRRPRGVAVPQRRAAARTVAIGAVAV
eukprot:7389584-Prymnesium_polylepis.1